MSDTVTLEIRRYRPEQEQAPTWERFEIPVREEWMVLDALNHVKDHLDGSLSFRWSCRMGVCGSCGMMVNGEPALTCATYLSALPRDRPVRVEPLQFFPVIRDLVIDMEDFVGKLQKAMPWIVRPEEKPLSEGEYLQTPEELAEYKQYSMCINCLLCYAACPIVGLEPHFIGPAALALAQRYNHDSRDQGRQERLEALGDEEGIWGCTFIGECSVVCPKNVDPAGAIQRYKVAATADWFQSILLPWSRR
jgi:fumarate reductase iron-sulfur subunit